MRTTTLAEILENKIKKGEYTDKLPTSRVLVASYNCSFSTVAGAIEILKSKDLIRTSWNGTYIKKRS